MSLSLLHIGCGRSPLPEELKGRYRETRLDIDPGVEPDVVASITDLGEVGSFDAIYTTHCLEHLYPFEVPVALAEFRRVLNPGGVAMVVVPDLEGIQATEDVVYDSPSGPVTGLDMYYGMARLMTPQKTYMAHHCGFVRETLQNVLEEAGFARVQAVRTGQFNLVAVAVQP